MNGLEECSDNTKLVVLIYPYDGRNVLCKLTYIFPVCIYMVEREFCGVGNGFTTVCLLY